MSCKRICGSPMHRTHNEISSFRKRSSLLVILALTVMAGGQVSRVPAQTPETLAPTPPSPAAPGIFLQPMENAVEAPPGMAFSRPRMEFLPSSLCWQPPLASPRAPRMFVQFNSLDNGYTRQNTDTAIGGEFGLFRFKSLAFPDTQYQIDFMGVHFSRWSERAWAVGGDYRYGFPVTFKSGPWEGKIGYEHTSTHVGDDFIKTHGRYKERYVRDEIVAGLSYRWWNQLRLYGEAAVAMWMASPVEKGSERYDWGFEWSRQEPTGWKGQPFAAFDMDLRPEQDFNPNICLQVGWQWIPCDQRTTSVRLAFEWYDGYAPYGQFFLMKDRWVGVGVFLDF